MPRKLKKYNFISTKEEQEIAEKYKAGVPEGVIANEYNISHWKVYNSLDKYGVPRRHKQKSIRDEVFSGLSDLDIVNILEDDDSGMSADMIRVKYDLKTEHTLRELRAKREFTRRINMAKDALNDVVYD